MRPFNKLVHPRGWRAFTEYGNGILGDMCIHMFDMVRWMLDLGWPKRISSSGGILVDKQSKANIPDTQTATFEFGDLPAGYRGASDSDAWRAQWRRLRAILRSREICEADPRPLASLVAARVGAIACIPDLLRLVSAPSGFVALVAKAAALRLGAPLERAGGLEEVGAFVPPEDLADASLWAVGEG